MAATFQSLLRRVKSGDLRNAAYLSCYYTYLRLRDLRGGTRTAVSSLAPQGISGSRRSTGNFPFHPKLVRRALAHIPEGDRGSFVDIGCGSGIALLEASRLRFRTVSGIELFPEVAELSRRNCRTSSGTPINVTDGNALDMDLSEYEVAWIFNPFKENEDYVRLFQKLIQARWILIAAAPDIVPPGSTLLHSYQHAVFSRFNFRVFLRNPN